MKSEKQPTTISIEKILEGQAIPKSVRKAPKKKVATKKPAIKKPAKKVVTKRTSNVKPRKKA